MKNIKFPCYATLGFYKKELFAQDLIDQGIAQSKKGAYEQFERRKKALELLGVKVERIGEDENTVNFRAKIETIEQYVAAEL